MTQQSSSRQPYPSSVAAEPELRKGQEVRILSGRYRGTVGKIAEASWDAVHSQWQYFITDGLVDLGSYTEKELW